MNNFNYKLKKYQPYEVIASKKIEILNKCTVLNFNNDNKYDFKTNDNLTYEVKADELSLKTGNIFIEYEGYNKKSGLSVSKADFYIITDTNDYYMIQTKKLKQLINKLDIKDKKIMNTFDKLTFGFVIRKNLIFDNCILI